MDAMAAQSDIRNVYRRHYANYIRGRRINALSLEAEAWFWRVHDTADDFGNNEGEALMCYAATVGLRRTAVKPDHVGMWLAEMATHRLIRFYEVEGVKYLHVVGFTVNQPGPRNGKPVHRFPSSPWDTPQCDVEPEVAPEGAIQMNPDASSASHSHSHSHSHSQLRAAHVVRRKADADCPPGFMEFWKEYPRCERKTGKAKCVRHWKRNGLESVAEKVIASLRRRKAMRGWTKDGGEFIPLPLTWLGRTEWEVDDEDLIPEDEAQAQAKRAVALMKAGNP